MSDFDEKELLEEDDLHEIEGVSIVEDEGGEVREIPLEELPTGWSSDVTTRPPMIFDDDERSDTLPPPIEYPDWTSKTSFVVSGPLADSKFPGRRFETRAAAKLWVLKTYGRIHQSFNIPGRWAYRVPRKVTP